MRGAGRGLAYFIFARNHQHIISSQQTSSSAETRSQAALLAGWPAGAVDQIQPLPRPDSQRATAHEGSGDEPNCHYIFSAAQAAGAEHGPAPGEMVTATATYYSSGETTLLSNTLSAESARRPLRQKTVEQGAG